MTEDVIKLPLLELMGVVLEDMVEEGDREGEAEVMDMGDLTEFLRQNLLGSSSICSVSQEEF